MQILAKATEVRGASQILGNCEGSQMKVFIK